MIDRAIDAITYLAEAIDRLCDLIEAQQDDQYDD
jgi:hypothetical protein